MIYLQMEFCLIMNHHIEEKRLNEERLQEQLVNNSMQSKLI